jgi:multidrug resistance efflux pump
VLELILCSLVTLLPDYLFRRYVQGKKLGTDITFLNMWYELRYGITTCLILTITVITVIFYYHPLTTNVASIFRTVTILPEALTPGRVEKVYVKLNDKVEAGAPIFKLDSSTQEATLETARRKVAEIDASIVVAQSQLVTADGQIQQAEAAYKQAVDALATKTELQQGNASTVSAREVERLRNAVDSAKGVVASANAGKATIEEQLSSLLPAQKATAEAALQEAQVELDKTTVRAGVAGTVVQFALRPGDVVNPLLRPAGILIPADAGGDAMAAGFSQLAGQVLKVGMAGEISCASKPFTIIPVVITEIQDAIATGQFRPSDQLIDIAPVPTGTITAFMQPIYPGQLADIPPGSSCVAVAYTDNHDRYQNEDLSGPSYLFLHAVDTMAVLKAALLRISALLLPVQSLVLNGH